MGKRDDDTVVRALTLPVRGVVGMRTKRSAEVTRLTTEERKGCYGRWTAGLRLQWQATTRLANWATAELYARDPGRGVDWETAGMPAFRPPGDLYANAVHHADGILDGVAVSATLQLASSLWRKQRWEVLTGRRSTPTKRYPAPLPLHKKSWRVDVTEDGEILFSYKSTPGNAWQVVRLGTNPRDPKARAWVRACAALPDEARCEAAILERSRTHGGGTDHRQGGRRKAPGGGNRRDTEIAVKLVARFPRRERPPGDRVLYVRSDPEAMLVYHHARDPENPADVPDERSVHRLHMDHARRWMREHARRAQRLSDDRKAERRRPPKERRRYNECSDHEQARYHRRMDSLTHEASRTIVLFAERTGCGSIVLDLSERSWDEAMRWYELAARIKYKADAVRIRVEDVTKERDAERVEALALAEA